MTGIRQWSVILASSSSRRPRWLDENGHITADPSRALRLVSPEVAARRVQAFMEIHGWPIGVMERFRLVPAPAAGASTARSGGRSHGPDIAAAA